MSIPQHSAYIYLNTPNPDRRLIEKDFQEIKVVNKDIKVIFNEKMSAYHFYIAALDARQQKIKVTCKNNYVITNYFLTRNP